MSFVLTLTCRGTFLLCLAAPAYAVTELIGRLFSDWLGYFPGSASIAGFVLWLFLRNDRIVSPIAGIHPPSGLAVADAAYIMNGKFSRADIIPLIIDWANRGYIRISEVEERGGLSGRKELLISKLRKMGGDEKELFDGVFSMRSGEQVSSFVLAEEDFDGALDKVRRTFVQSRSIFKEGNILVPGELSKKALLITAPTFVYIWYMVFVNMLGPTRHMAMLIALFVSFWAGIVLAAVQYFLFTTIKGQRKEQRITCIVVGLFWLIIVSFVASFAMRRAFSFWLMLEMLDISNPLSLSFACRHRTKLGLEYLAQLTGFKNFLETAGVGQIYGLANENPRYFYDTLPYAMALGVADKFAKKFDHVALQPPEWYEGSGARFTPSSFVSELNDGLSGLARERRW